MNRVLLGWTDAKGRYKTEVVPGEGDALKRANGIIDGAVDVFASWADPDAKAGLRVRRIVRGEDGEACFHEADETVSNARRVLGIDRAAAVEPAPKAPVPTPAPAAAKPTRASLSDDQIVVLSSPLNPKTPGKKNHERFQAMMNRMRDGRISVGDALRAGVTRGDLRHDVEAGHVRIVRPGEEGS